MSDKNIVVYTTTGCTHCKAVKKFLDDNDVSYVEKNIAEDDGARQELSDKGITSVPVVESQGRRIMGFQRDELKELLEI